MRHRRIDTNGITLHVAEEGEGPVVLFIHGFPALWSSWRSQMGAVAAAGWRALAPDMRGYGESDAPRAAEAYMPFHTVGDLVGLLDGLEIPTAVIVGHDFGANIAWNAALMRPDRFTAVFGISVPFLPMGSMSFLDQLREKGADDFYMFAQMRPEADAAWADATRTIPGVYYWTSGQAPPGKAWDPLDPRRGLLRPAPEPVTAVDEAYLREAVTTFARTGFRGGLNYYRSIDPFFALASGAYRGAVLRQPSYFLVGARDGLNKLRDPSESELRTALTGLRGFTMLDGVGHWPQLEAPLELNRRLLEFLSGL